MIIADLLKIQEMRERLKEYDEKIEEYRLAIQSVVPNYDWGPRGNAYGDKISGEIARLLEMRKIRRDKYCEIEAAISEAENAVNALPSHRMRQVIQHRYLYAHTWGETSRAMQRTPRQCQRYMQDALTYLRNNSA